MAAAILLSSACGSPTAPDSSVTRRFNFSEGPQDWVAGFADYPAGQELFMELQSAYAPLPPLLGSGRSALFISGNNHSDDLFMFFKRRLDGLRPSTTYTATFAVEFATNVPRGCVGIGGAPGESVFMKAGASTAEPRVIVESGALRVTVDKGNQAVGGSHALVLGTVENSLPCTRENLQSRPWERKTLSSGSQTIGVESDANGSVWLLMGTDSGFEGTTSLYYLSFDVDLAISR
jgi:hypothetical protein